MFLKFICSFWTVTSVSLLIYFNLLLSQGMRGLWLWTVTLFSFGLFLRGEEPLRLKVRHLKLPPNYQGINCYPNFGILYASLSIFKFPALSSTSL